ncbi:alpha/beta hydrolase [Marinilactibacillus kalidii]|uniref:alpha/beta hydrolase n=1 Tax=Marinilactibacillus kalidii TaxID=2820274 RepID=UPI001ABE3299|nr:alpha/beta fold hydrolase [Marinilactibacillus kalidii]
MNKRIAATVLGGLGATIGALAVTGNYFYKTAVANTKKPFIEEFDHVAIHPDDPWADEKIWYNEAEREVTTILSDDGLSISGIYIPAAKPSKKVALIAHGYSGSSKDMAPFAKLFHDLDFNILVSDARGHGDSEGNYIGFGWHERNDYLRWIDQMIERHGEEAEIVLFGISMGGATVLNVSGEQLPPQVKAIVEDCGFSSVEEEITHQLKDMYKLPKFPLVQVTSLVTKIRAGYWFEEASSLEQVKKNQTPTLFIHGDADHFVPTWMVHELYEANASAKELYVVPGAEHAYAYVTDKETYRHRVSGFLSHYVTLDQTL